MEDLLTSINQTSPALVVLSGDFTQRARHAEFAEARRFLERISQPKLVVPGNHDVPLFNLFARFVTPLAKYDRYVAPTGHSASLFCDDELAVLGLNTARPFSRKNGRVSIDQIAEIGRVFRDVPAKRFKAVVTHHPIGIPDREARLEIAGRSRLALAAIADAGVHLLLSGHHHRAASGHIGDVHDAGSVLVVHAGTAVSTRLRGNEGNTYNLIRIAGERVSVCVMGWTAGNGFREDRRLSFVFEKSRWRPAPA